MGNRIPSKTEEYLKNGAPEGVRNAALFDAACQLRDARWHKHEINEILVKRGVLDGLTESEVMTTIKSVFNRPERQSIQTRSEHPMMRMPLPQYDMKVEHDAEPVVYALDEADELPEPLADPSVTFLKALFNTNDKIQLVCGKRTDDGGESPTGGSAILPVEQWCEKITQKNGADELFAAHDEKGKVNQGLFVSINPLFEAKLGRKIKNVARLQYALLEFDTISIKQQWQLFKKSKIPCATICYSGNKSLHALVKVDARTIEDYKERVQFLFNHFAEYDVDVQNKDPSRLSRLPGVKRGDTNKEQTLLAVNTGYKTWSEWKESLDDSGLKFPEIMTQEDFYNEEISEPPKIIEGLLHRQLSLVIGGSSKTYKSWTLLDMAMSVANGEDFWGLKTEKGKVLYINFEIADYYMRERLKAVSDAKGISIPSKNLYVWNLRGRAQALETIKPTFTKVMANANFSMVILDPIYKTLGNRDENAAGDINSLMNEMEHMALETGAAVVFATHFSKGNQAAKSPIDRISGSGVFARSPDTILVMTEHEDDDCYTVDATVRNFETPKPFVVKMQFPMFERVEADPAKLKRPGGRPQAEDCIPEVMDFLSRKGERWTKQTDIVKMMEEQGNSASTIKRQIQKAVKDGMIERQSSPGKPSQLRKSTEVIYVA